MTREELEKQDIRLNKLCFDYQEKEKRIEELERENRTLKSLLYCTKRSCNNCGKVNCENFQRQRIDCCGLWVSYKDYITELENKIADIKANCDLAIEGRDIKIKELEDHLAEEVELHLHAEEYIKELEQQIEKMKCCQNCENWNWKHKKCEKKLKGDCFKQSKWVLRKILSKEYE